MHGAGGGEGDVLEEGEAGWFAGVLPGGFVATVRVLFSARRRPQP